MVSMTLAVPTNSGLSHVRSVAATREVAHHSQTGPSLVSARWAGGAPTPAEARGDRARAVAGAHAAE